MGYCMHQGDSRFRIQREALPRALAGLNALAARAARQRRGAYSWVNTQVIADATSVEAHLNEWRWVPSFDHAGHLTGLSFEGEKLGDDKLLFDALAPAVEAGGFIVMHGEDGECWRWYFDGATCLEQAAQVGFGPVPGDIVDVPAREIKPATALTGTPRALPR